ncbi:MAG: hypothetical protein KDA78_11995, partial [Planctomycetaceae bacterium]|nr:hypothetical protein [Planctomycetaceae bacterium]
MKFQDPCHPESPTLEEQADALRKGLGRAMIWACSGKLDDGPLLHACLHDQRHDMQVEETRGSWLWQLVQTVGGENRFRTSLLEELQRLPDERNVYQLCELACHYAAMGENEFRRRLYEIVEHQPVPDAARLGEKEILKLDGADAFVFIAGIRGRRLESRDWDWDDD